MPIYEYRCKKCGEITERFVSKYPEVEERWKCPKCGSRGKKEKLTSRTSFQFTGSGFYSTDYGKN